MPNTPSASPQSNKRLIILLVSACLLLFVPLLAMQFSHEVTWSAFDFIVAGIILLGTAVMTEFILRKIKTINYRFIALGFLILFVVLLWAELAVGVFGTPFGGN